MLIISKILCTAEIRLSQKQNKQINKQQQQQKQTQKINKQKTLVLVTGNFIGSVMHSRSIDLES